MLERSPRTVLGLESRACGPLSEILLRQPTLSNRATLVLEMMSDEALASFPPEVRMYCIQRNPSDVDTYRTEKVVQVALFEGLIVCKNCSRCLY